MLLAVRLGPWPLPVPLSRMVMVGSMVVVMNRTRPYGVGEMIVVRNVIMWNTTATMHCPACRLADRSAETCVSATSGGCPVLMCVVTLLVQLLTLKDWYVIARLRIRFYVVLLLLVVFVVLVV